jgi:hypothetical protein
MNDTEKKVTIPKDSGSRNAETLKKYFLTIG